MIKVELDGEFTEGDLIAQDPQFGPYYFVKSVEGLIHTLTTESKGFAELTEGKKILKIGNVLGEYSESVCSALKDIPKEPETINVVKIH